MIEESVAQIVEVLDNTAFSYEIIFLDHCSKDRTRGLIGQIVDRHPDEGMSRVFHEHNKARGGTVADGIRVGTEILS